MVTMNGQPLGLELSNAHPEQLNPAILIRVLGALRIMFYSSRPPSCPDNHSSSFEFKPPPGIIKITTSHPPYFASAS